MGRLHRVRDKADRLDGRRQATSAPACSTCCSTDAIAWLRRWISRRRRADPTRCACCSSINGGNSRDVVRTAAARGQLGDRALEFLSFVSAGDALMAFDQAAPALGARISAADLRRLARIMAPQCDRRSAPIQLRRRSGAATHLRRSRRRLRRPTLSSRPTRMSPSPPQPPARPRPGCDAASDHDDRRRRTPRARRQRLLRLRAATPPTPTPSTGLHQRRSCT